MIKKLLITFLVALAPVSTTQDLSLKFTQGMVKNYATSLNLSMVQKVPDACDMKYDIEAQFDLNHTVKGLSGENALIEVSITNPQVKVAINCEGEESPFKVALNSQLENPETDEDKIFKKSIQNLNGLRYLITVTPQGKITNFEGLTQIKNKLEGENQPINSMVTQTLMTFLTQSYLEALHQPLFSHIPNKGVTVEESWTQEKFNPLKHTLTLTSVNDKEMVINQNFTFQTSKNQEGDLQFTLDMKGEAKGSLVLSTQDHWPLSNEGSGTFEGVQRLTFPGLAEPFEIPLSVRAAISYKLKN